MKTAQLEQWRGEFGRAYTDRNSLTPTALDALYRKNFGVARSELNQRFLANVPRDARILEVGCNEGNQLCALREMGFRRLYGVEIQEYALRRAQQRLESAQFALATAFEIPYPDGFFDLVFTSGVLIHISPADLPRALREVHRCAGGFIWGHEYYSPQPMEVTYRGHQSLLWKADYARLYLDLFADLELVRAEQIPYLEDANVDCMFLLSRRRPASAASGRDVQEA
ncbi:MAG: pseudaminic acid biosynthesis-associated methylase [Terriglobales bacterium]